MNDEAHNREPTPDLTQGDEMPHRTWFTPVTTPIPRGEQELTIADCRILNRAARNIWKPGQEPRHSDLMGLRMNYRPGMSAADLLEEVAGVLP